MDKNKKLVKMINKQTPYDSLVKDLYHDYFYAQNQEPPSEMPTDHWHNHIEFNYLHSGSIEYSFGGKKHIIPSQKLIFFWGGVPHKNIRNIISENGEQTSLFNLYYPLEDFLLLDNVSEVQHLLLDGSILVLNAPTSFIKPLVQVWQLDIKQRKEQAIKAIGFEIRALLERYSFEIMYGDSKERTKKTKTISTQKQKIFVQTLRYILHNLQEPLNSADIAKALGFHQNYIQRVFHEFLGLSIHQFTVRTRLKYACSLLRESNKPVLDIAIEAGFGSISQFYKSFHYYYKQTPRQYRQK